MKLVSSDDFGKTWQLDRCFYSCFDCACQPKLFDDFDEKDCVDNEYNLEEECNCRNIDLEILDTSD